jgi:hypothetical protein
LAKNVESTDSTARDPHLGQAGLWRPCSLIGMVRLKRRRHRVQRNS